MGDSLSKIILSCHGYENLVIYPSEKFSKSRDRTPARPTDRTTVRPSVRTSGLRLYANVK